MFFYPDGVKRYSELLDAELDILCSNGTMATALPEIQDKLKDTADGHYPHGEGVLMALLQKLLTLSTEVRSKKVEIERDESDGWYGASSFKGKKQATKVKRGKKITL